MRCLHEMEAAFFAYIKQVEEYYIQGGGIVQTGLPGGRECCDLNLYIECILSWHLLSSARSNL